MFPSSNTLMLLFIPLFVLTIYMYFKWNSSNSSKSEKNLPPSPPRLPIIGNLHQLGLAPHRSLKTLAHKYGSLMLLHFGSVPVVIASSAEAAGEILKTHDAILSDRSKTRVQSILTYGAKNVAFAHYGEYWRQTKSIYVLNLLSAKRVQMFRKVREDETKFMIDMIHNHTSNNHTIDLTHIIVSLTNSIICRVTMGRKYDAGPFIDHVGNAMELLGVFSVGTYIPSLSWVDRLSGLEARARKIAEEVDEFLDSMVEDHLQGARRSEDSVVVGHDVVDILIEIQKEQAKTNMVVNKDAIKVFILEMFVAGTDTTSTSLEWGISELISHPRIMQKLQEEVTEIAQGSPIISEEDFDKTQHPYLEAVLKETMRLHPPVPLLLPRESMQDVKLMSYDIAKGTQVIINAWMIARDPTTWEEPDEFKPERFLNNNIDYKGLDFEFLPFGGGRRGCPGIQFGMAVNKLALANLVYKFDFKLPNGGRVEELDMSESFGVAVRRKHPLLVVAIPRF